MNVYGKKNGNFWVFLIVFIFLIILANLFSSGARGGFYRISNPIQERLWPAGQSVYNFLGGIAAVGSTQNEINELRRKNAEIELKLISFGEMENENNTLKEALGLELQNKYRLILGKFTSKNTSEDIVVINKGSNDGVAKGMPIITQGGIVAGKISEVYPTYSKAFLLSSKEMSFDVRIKHNEKDIFAVAKGGDNLKINLNFIPRQEEVSEGDMIITDALGGVFPDALAVGRVKGLIKSDISPFQEAEADPFFNIQEAKEIFIVSMTL
ncbi:MAG: rod shape-determining protein MreC [bacterium]|nr:rod shape-determining protein MreC [bacterium]